MVPVSGLYRSDWQDALQHLTFPGISELNFVPETLTVFATHISPPSLCLRITHQFFSAVNPDVYTSDFVMHLRVLSIAYAMSLWSAFDFIRAQAPEDQASLREGVWAWALGAPLIPAGVLPPAAAAQARKAGMGMGVQKDVLQQMLHLPMTPAESDHLAEFLAHPPRPQGSNHAISPKALDVLHDLVVLRMVHRGQYEQSIALDKALSGRAAGVTGNGADVGAGAGTGEEGRQRRRELIREFVDVLPPAQRRMLSLLPPPAQHAGAERAPKQVNGIAGCAKSDFGEDTAMDTDAYEPESISVKAAAGGSSMTASRVSAYAELSAATASPASTAARPSPATPRVQAVSSASTARTVSVSSPFGGPPQFRQASTASTSSVGAGAVGGLSRNVSGVSNISGRSVSRLPSGSPFVLPPGTKVDVPRPSERAQAAKMGSAVGRSSSGEKRVGRHVSVVAPDEEDVMEEEEVSEDGQIGEGVTNDGSDNGSRREDVEMGQDEMSHPRQGDDVDKPASPIVKNTRTASRGKAKASNDMPPPPVPQQAVAPAAPTSVRRSGRRAGSVTPSVASTNGDDASDSNDVSPTPTPGRASRASSRGITRTSSVAHLDDGSDAGTRTESNAPAKKLRSSKSVANLSSTSRTSSRLGSVHEQDPPAARTRTRSTPGASLGAGMKKSSTTADLAQASAGSTTPMSKARANRTTTTRTRKGNGEDDDVLPALPGSFATPGGVRRSSRRAGSVTSTQGSDDDADSNAGEVVKLDKGKGRAERSVSPALSTASVRSTRSRAGREGSATPRARR